jgi:hypothetical protein
MKLQIDAHGDLGNQHEHDDWDELCMDVLGELSALMSVTEKVSGDCEDGSEGLYGDVPFRSYYLIVWSVRTLQFCMR